MAIIFRLVLLFLVSFFGACSIAPIEPFDKPILGGPSITPTENVTAYTSAWHASTKRFEQKSFGACNADRSYCKTYTPLRTYHIVGDMQCRLMCQSENGRNWSKPGKIITVCKHRNGWEYYGQEIPYSRYHVFYSSCR